MGWRWVLIGGHTTAGVPVPPWGQTQGSAVPPAWDMVVPLAPHRALAQSGQALVVSPRLWDRGAGADGGCVSAPAAP